MLLVLALAYLAGGAGVPTPHQNVTEPSIFSARDFSSLPTRDVWQIVWSCASTTLTCTWVSVHPNVPFFPQSDSAGILRRLYLMLLSLIMPEFVASWAIAQNLAAWRVKREINRVEDRKWSMTHAFFVVMGGFRLRYTGTIPDFSFRESGTAYKHNGKEISENVITFTDFKRLLELKIIDFPSITKKQIKDKSKSDALAKAYAFTQLVWFVIHIIARHYEDLQVTQLELTTGALVFVNCIMYITWFQKPLDVRCPVILYKRGTYEELQFSHPPETRHMSEHWWETPWNVLRGVCNQIWESVEDMQKPLGDWMIVRGTPTLLRRIILLLLQVLYIPILFSIAVNMFIWGYLFLFPLFAISSSERIENSNIYRSVIKMRQGLQRNAVGIPLRSMFYSTYERDTKDVVLSTFLPTIILCTAFGGMHCLAWNFPFPTLQEQFYWKVAVCLLTATVPLIFSFFIATCFIFAGYLFLLFITEKTLPDSGYWVGATKAFDYVVAQPVVGGTLGSLILYYVLSRIGVLVIGFTTLRSLSDSALHNVEWTSHIPHVQ